MIFNRCIHIFGNPLKSSFGKTPLSIKNHTTLQTVSLSNIFLQIESSRLKSTDIIIVNDSGWKIIGPNNVYYDAHLNRINEIGLHESINDEVIFLLDHVTLLQSLKQKYHNLFIHTENDYLDHYNGKILKPRKNYLLNYCKQQLNELIDTRTQEALVSMIWELK